MLLRVTKWLVKQAPVQRLASQRAMSTLTRQQVIQAMAVICILLFAKFIYIAAITNYLPLPQLKDLMFQFKPLSSTCLYF